MEDFMIDMHANDLSRISINVFGKSARIVSRAGRKDGQVLNIIAEADALLRDGVCEVVLRLGWATFKCWCVLALCFAHQFKHGKVKGRFCR